MSESQPADLSLMRELNERIVLSLLRQAGPISRAELARRSNLSRSTVSSIIASLLASDLVRETGIGDSSGGRRPIMIEFNYQSGYVVGIELGNTALTVLLTVVRRVRQADVEHSQELVRSRRESAVLAPRKSDRCRRSG